MSNSSMPHDGLFKLFLTDENIAKEFLQIHLPHSAQQQLDFDTLELAPGAFVENDLSQHYSDIAYSIRLINEHKSAYILLEHESAVGKLTPFKISRYQSALMKRHLNQGDTSLPVVLPIIFYRGVGSYRGPLRLLECFNDETFAQETLELSKPIQLISLSAIPDDILITHKRCAALELAQKYIYSWDLKQLVPKIFELFDRYPLDNEKKQGLLYYLAIEGQATDQQFVQLMINTAPHYREDIMFAGQYLIEEGRQKGHQQGHHEGLQKGWQNAMLETAKNMLTGDLPFDVIKQVTKLSDDTITALMPEKNHTASANQADIVRAP